MARALATAGHAASAIGADDIGRADGLPRRTCERRFRAQLGQSLLDELRRERLTHGKRLLQESRPIAEAAASVGMSTSAFRAVVGTTRGR